MFMIRASLIASLLLFCSAPLPAEDRIPAGTKVKLPNGFEAVISEDLTCITVKEKEILVRNDDLWQVDQQKIKILQEKIAELESGGGLDSREVELLKAQIEMEQQRISFYKEQIEARDKLHDLTTKELIRVIEQEKSSWWEKAMAKGGWIAIFITIGIIIGVAL